MLSKKKEEGADWAEALSNMITTSFRKKQSVDNDSSKTSYLNNESSDVLAIIAGARAERAAQRVGMGVNAITAAINAASLAATVWSTKRDQDNVELIAAAAGRAAAKYWEDAMKLEYSIQSIPNEVIGDSSVFESLESFNNLDFLLKRLDRLYKLSDEYMKNSNTKMFNRLKRDIEETENDLKDARKKEIIAAQKKSRQDPRTRLSWAKHDNFPLAERKDARRAVIALDKATKVLASYRMKNPRDAKEIKRMTNIVKEAEQRVQETDKELKDAMEIAKAAIRDKEEQLYPNDGPAEKRMELAILKEEAAVAAETTAANNKIAKDKKRAADAAIRDKEEQLYQLYPKDSPAEKRMELAILKEEEAAVAADTKAANYKIEMDKQAADAGEAEANRVSELPFNEAKLKQLKLEREDDIIARNLMAKNAASHAMIEESQASKIKQTAQININELDDQIHAEYNKMTRQKLISEKERAIQRKEKASDIIFNWQSAYLAWEKVVKYITNLDIITQEDDNILVELEQFASDNTDMAMKIIHDRIEDIKKNYNELFPDEKQELDSLESSWETANATKIGEIAARIEDLNLRKKLGSLNLQEINELQRLEDNARRLNVFNMLSQSPQKSFSESSFHLKEY